jgi:tRNA-modifying protein YgfZ
MREDLRAAQKQQGAIFALDEPAVAPEENGADVRGDRPPIRADGGPVSFGNDAAAVVAALQGVALYDRSHWGRLRVTDRDRQLFLHNQSTNNLNALKPGQGCDTVFVTSTARTIDLATAYVLDAAVWVVVSPQRRQTLLPWLDRYIFFGDKVQVADVTAETALFNLIGPDSDALLDRLGAGAIVGQPPASHQALEIGGVPVQIAVGSGLGLAGYTLWLDAAPAAQLWQTLITAGATALGDRPWNQIRIQQGRPSPDTELTDDYNPLEAGLWQAVSFSKGCYIGQETIARLDTYKGVKVQLWGIQLQAPAPPGTPIWHEQDKVGVLTSVTETAAGPFGLAYIRTKAGGAGLQVQVAGQPGEVVEVPFLTREKST